MIDLPAVGAALDTMITDPQAFATSLQTWVETNATLMGSVAVGALAVSGAAGFGWSAIAKWMGARRDERRRFGGAAAARRANLLRNPSLKHSGIPIGRFGRRRLCWINEEPVLVTGGTRSGKGVGVIRPACLTYGGPVVMYDGGKGELFRDTSGYRARFSHVLNLDLTNPNGVHWNPLDEIDPRNPVAGADNIAKAVPRPANPNGFFESGAERLIGAVTLHVLHAEPDHRKNMARVVEIISQGDEGLREIIRTNAHPVAVSRATAMFAGVPFGDPPGGSEKERGGVVSSALNRLAAFEDPIVAEITSRSDFRMRDISRLSPAGRPVSLYLTTPASEDDRLRPVVSLFLSMFLNSVMAEQPKLEGQPMTLIVADEFPSLRMEILQTAITKSVGCGATFLLGAQSLNALRQAPYGPYNLFRDNIRCYIAYAANDGMTQQEIARSCGTVSETRKSSSRSRQVGSFAGSHSESESDIEVPVMDAGEVRSMKDSDELIFITGQPVIKAKKIRDFDDRILKKRLGLPTPRLRGADGVYPDLPHPARPSPWAGVMKASLQQPVQSEPQSANAARAAPKSAGKGIALVSSYSTNSDDDMPEAPEWADPAPAPEKPKPKRKRRLVAAPKGDE